MKTNDIVKYQIKVLIESWSTVSVWIILLSFVVANFVHNCSSNIKMHYVSEMYDPIKTLTLSGWSAAGGIFMYVYPLVLVIPTAMLFYNEKSSKVNVYIQARCGFGLYYYGSAIAVIVLTFLLFTIPFMLELVLTFICFDNNSIKDPSGLQYYAVLTDLDRVIFHDIWIISPKLYGVVMTLRFGVISSVLSLFNYSFTTSPRIKYKMLTIIPLVSVLYALMIIDRFIPGNLTYILAIPMFENTNENEIIWNVVMIILLMFSLLKLKANEKYYYCLRT